jgi:hypothetical protein
LIQQTKSRPRHSNDNGLVESKNGAVIREHMGYGYIAAQHATALQAFYVQYFGANAIGEVVFETAGLSVVPARGVYQSNLTFAGATFAPKEGVQIFASGVGSRVLASRHGRWKRGIHSHGSESTGALRPAVVSRHGQEQWQAGSGRFRGQAPADLEPEGGHGGQHRRG